MDEQQQHKAHAVMVVVAAAIASSASPVVTARDDHRAAGAWLDSALREDRDPSDQLYGVWSVVVQL